MLFALYNEDGSIHQANKIYDMESIVDGHYGKLLEERGHKFVCVENAPRLISGDHFMVDVKAQEIIERPLMTIEVSKTRVKAGDDSDSALLTKIPRSAVFTILTSNIAVHSGIIDAEELELYIPVPCIYKVTFDLWPYKRFEVDIEAYT